MKQVTKNTFTLSSMKKGFDKPQGHNRLDGVLLPDVEADPFTSTEAVRGR